MNRRQGLVSKGCPYFNKVPPPIKPRDRPVKVLVRLFLVWSRRQRRIEHTLTSNTVNAIPYSDRALSALRLEANKRSIKVKMTKAKLGIKGWTKKETIEILEQDVSLDLTCRVMLKCVIGRRDLVF